MVDKYDLCILQICFQKVIPWQVEWSDMI